MQNQIKRKIEIFTAGCSVCEPMVEMVKSMACSSCEIVVYNLSQPCETKECLEKVQVDIPAKVLQCSWAKDAINS